MKKLVSVCVGLCITALLLTLLNYTLDASKYTSLQNIEEPHGLIQKEIGVISAMKAPFVEERYEIAKWRYPHESIGEQLIPNSMARHQLYDHKNQKMIFDVVYEHDHHPRRVGALSPHRDKALLLFGGSFTYGHGLSKTETLDYFLTSQSQDFIAYNYGYPGIGPNHVLAQLLRRNYAKEITENKGWFFYILIQDHVWRAIGNSHWRAEHMPYFEEVPDGVISRGTFIQAQPWLTKALIYFREINLIKRFSIQWPFVMRKSYIDYSCKIILQIKKELKKQLPNFKFAVILHPRYKNDDRDTSPNHFKECFRQKNILFFDYINDPRLGLIDSPLYIPHDGHPTAALNKHLADYILKDIDKLSNKENK